MTDFATTQTAPLPVNQDFDSWCRFLYWAGHAVPEGYQSFTEDEYARWKSICVDWDSPRFKSAVRSYQYFTAGTNTHTQTSDGPLHGDGICGRFTKASIHRRLCAHRDIGPNQFGAVQWDTSQQHPVTTEWTGPDHLQATGATFDLSRLMFNVVCGIWSDRAKQAGQGDIYAGCVRLDNDSGVLGDSYSPGVRQKPRSAGGTRRIRQRYDYESLWANLGNILTVMFHELEHALWADGHIPVSQGSNIINPMFIGSRVEKRNGIWIPLVGDLERQYMVRNYGQPRTTEPIPPTDPPPGGDSFETAMAIRRAGTSKWTFTTVTNVNL